MTPSLLGCSVCVFTQLFLTKCIHSVENIAIFIFKNAENKPKCWISRMIAGRLIPVISDVEMVDLLVCRIASRKSSQLFCFCSLSCFVHCSSSSCCSWLLYDSNAPWRYSCSPRSFSGRQNSHYDTRNQMKLVLYETYGKCMG